MNVKSVAKGIIGILFAIFMLAGMIMCNRPVTQPTKSGPINTNQIDTPDNLIPPTDTDGANQNRWGL